MKPRICWFLAKKQRFLVRETRSQKKKNHQNGNKICETTFGFTKTDYRQTWNHLWFQKNWLKIILRAEIWFLRSKQARLKIADGSCLQFRGTSVFAWQAQISQVRVKYWFKSPKMASSGVYFMP